MQIDRLYCSFKPVRVCDCFSFHNIWTIWIFPGPLKDQTRLAIRLKTVKRVCEERETSVICFEKYPHQEILSYGWLLLERLRSRYPSRSFWNQLFTICDRAIHVRPRLIITGWRPTEGIKKLIFMSRITLLSTFFQDIAPKIITKTFVLNNGDKRQNVLASSSLLSVYKESVFWVSLPGIPIPLGIWVWGYPKQGDTQITVTAGKDPPPVPNYQGKSPGNEVTPKAWWKWWSRASKNWTEAKHV